MNEALSRTRRRFALLALVTILVPAYGILGVALTVDTEVITGSGRTETNVTDAATRPDDHLVLAGLVLVPIAAALAWWLSGLAIRPLTQALGIQRTLIESANHDLRTPVAVLRTNADVSLADADATPDELRAAIRRSGLAAERIERTLTDLVDASRDRVRELQSRRTDLLELVIQAVDPMRALAAAADVTIRIDGDAVTTDVHAASVERAVHNLVDNAIRHSPPGASITVGVDPSGRAITVRDEGRGIPSDLQNALSRPTGEATHLGLGLRIVADVARAHHGAITIESPTADDHGTAVTLWFCEPSQR